MLAAFAAEGSSDLVEATSRRRLAAILAADASGYSRLMASDEPGTVAACRQLRAWSDAGLDAPRCAVNLSARQFGSESLLDDVRDSLRHSALARLQAGRCRRDAALPPCGGSRAPPRRAGAGRAARL
ncbi:MAG: hypothetical protein KDG44_10990, partial [Burkholderiaceae bacterium]|nr:hypothetical protein [Burkholderiaceae bacterium]